MQPHARTTQTRQQQTTGCHDLQVAGPQALEVEALYNPTKLLSLVQCTLEHIHGRLSDIYEPHIPTTHLSLIILADNTGLVLG